MFPEAKLITVDELRVGLKAEFEKDVLEEDIFAFAKNSGDFNPLHVNEQYAAQTQMKSRIAHGAYQVGLASAMLGMHLPGRQVLLGGIHSRFPSPLRFPSKVKVSGEVISWDPKAQVGALKVMVIEVPSGTPTAEISISFSLHEMAKKPQRLAEKQNANASLKIAGDVSKKLILLTGASGGIGTALVRSLAKDYRVIAMTYRGDLDSEIANHPQVTSLRASLIDPSFTDLLRVALGANKIYGIVHAAWPGAPHGGLLNVDPDTIDSQLAFGTKHLITLANMIFANVEPAGGRIVAIGSTAGTEKPQANMAAYSLGKAALEHTVKLLATELSRKKITINAVCPSLVPVGINRNVNERQQMKEVATIPAARLCQPEDVIAAVKNLLCENSSFISGQSIKLTGAQL